MDTHIQEQFIIRLLNDIIKKFELKTKGTQLN